MVPPPRAARGLLGLLTRDPGPRSADPDCCRETASTRSGTSRRSGRSAAGPGTATGDRDERPCVRGRAAPAAPPLRARRRSPKTAPSALSSRGSISAGPSSRTLLTGPRPRVTGSSSGGGPSSSASSAARSGSSQAPSTAGAEDHRHPVVDGAHELVRGAGDDRAAMQDDASALGRQPGPNPGERKQLASGRLEPDRPLAALVGSSIGRSRRRGSGSGGSRRRRGRPAPQRPSRRER